jgi:hypothetical protein
MSHHSEEGKDGEEKCKYCDYYASSRALIRKHENTHVKLEDTFEKICGAKKFACKLCPYKAVIINEFLFLKIVSLFNFFLNNLERYNSFIEAHSESQLSRRSF